MFEELKEMELLKIDGGTMNNHRPPHLYGIKDAANPPRTAP